MPLRAEMGMKGAYFARDYCPHLAAQGARVTARAMKARRGRLHIAHISRRTASAGARDPETPACTPDPCPHLALHGAHVAAGARKHGTPVCIDADAYAYTAPMSRRGR